jgi:transcriptional regulator with GAF, ATPase, and Fis domain
MIDDGLAELYDSRFSEAETLETIVEWAQKAVDATDAGIFLLQPKGALEIAVPTSPGAKRAHELQIDLAEGPCLEVIADDSVGTFIIGDTQSDRRFPNWGPAVAAVGIRSAISVILETPEKQFGSLNVYSQEPHSFNRDDMHIIEIFSTRAARAMAVAEHHTGMTTALDTRKLIGQAQGILMERFGIDGDRAFGFLVRQSQQRNVKLRLLAEWIVTHRERPLSDLDL